MDFKEQVKTLEERQAKHKALVCRALVSLSLPEAVDIAAESEKFLGKRRARWTAKELILWALSGELMPGGGVLYVQSIPARLRRGTFKG